FLSLTRQLVRQLHLAPGAAAGDGTVIEAAASHYRLLKADAAREAAARAPDDARAQAAAAAATAREAERRAHGRDGETTRVSPSEPEAVVQPLKNGARRPSYKPSALAHETGLIVGQVVEPSDEGAAVAPLLAQHQAIMGAPPVRTLLDAGYHQLEVLGWFVAAELDVLCPAGKADRGVWEKAGAGGKHGKARFAYDQEHDEYICPAGQRLSPGGRGKDRGGRRFREYGGAPCPACPQRDRCTTNRHGRIIKRYEGDELKEAMTQVLEQPRARRAYRRRKAMIEPVFAALRERQGLTRFHRRGLAGVRLEFALHCLAYNLGRALRGPADLNPPFWRLNLAFWPAARAVMAIFVVRPFRWSPRLYAGVIVAYYRKSRP
ncbi:MAG: hypothetical protein EHM24_33605, partial [Acidobacteria bacterium]